MMEDKIKNVDYLHRLPTYKQKYYEKFKMKNEKIITKT